MLPAALIKPLYTWPTSRRWQAQTKTPRGATLGYRRQSGGVRIGPFEHREPSHATNPDQRGQAHAVAIPDLEVPILPARHVGDSGGSVALQLQLADPPARFDGTHQHPEQLESLRLALPELRAIGRFSRSTGQTTASRLVGGPGAVGHSRAYVPRRKFVVR